MECEYCKKKLSSKSALILHQKKTIYCLKLQGKNTKGEFNCEYCGQDFTYKSALQSHYHTCSANKPFVKDTINKFQQYEFENKELKNRILSLEKDKIDLQEKYDNMILNLIKTPTTTINNNTMNNIINKEIEKKIAKEVAIEIDCDEIEEETENSEEKKLKPLDLGSGYQIENRESDGYINVTNLCKAGGKKFGNWRQLNRTFDFLKELSNAVGIPTASLIQYQTGYGDTQGTWVHPQLAINIAQWISPQFDVKVSAWVYEIMMTGKIDITNTKSYRELQEENKTNKLQIKKLTKKYVKSQPRVQYKEQNVIYILTTPSLKKERRYILGKATNLTNRLSTYNKSDEHEVMYYEECPDSESMAIVETLVFQKLKKYREQANRERFILPKEENIDFFRDVVKGAIEFIMK
jgi:hypothetical protein